MSKIKWQSQARFAYLMNVRYIHINGGRQYFPSILFAINIHAKVMPKTDRHYELLIFVHK